MKSLWSIWAEFPTVEGQAKEELMGAIEAKDFQIACQIFGKLFGRMENMASTDSCTLTDLDLRDDERWEENENFPPVIGGKIFTHKETGIKTIIFSKYAVKFALSRKPVPLLSLSIDKK